ncbi:MAG: hypothetical protein KF901_23900 [Myxococcales bacterium]|nr:hypothetical protein [Myxococcales bacterium]
MAGRFALGAAREVGRVLGPRAGLAALRPLLDGIEDVALRRAAHLDAIDLAARVDEASLAEMTLRWSRLPAGGRFEALARRCVALAKGGRVAAARALASAEVERSPGNGRAPYLRARLTDDPQAARADLERTLWLARRDHDHTLVAAASSRLARLELEPPRHPLDLAALAPEARLPLLVAQLRAKGRYGRVAALDGLVALAAALDEGPPHDALGTRRGALGTLGEPKGTLSDALGTLGDPQGTRGDSQGTLGDSQGTRRGARDGLRDARAARRDAVARAAIRACAEHADREARLTPIEVDRVRSALARWPDPIARDVALGRLAARESLCGAPNQRATAATSAATSAETDAASNGSHREPADAALGEAFARARAVLERSTAGPPGASLTVEWRALDAIAAQRLGEPDVADRIEALLAALDAARPAPSAPLLTLAWLACTSSAPPLRAIGERLAERIVALRGPQPPRGWLRLAERVTDPALAGTLLTLAREHREPGATEAMVADRTRRAFAAHAAGRGEEALELLREAKRLSQT